MQTDEKVYVPGTGFEPVCTEAADFKSAMSHQISSTRHRMRFKLSELLSKAFEH